MHPKSQTTFGGAYFVTNKRNEPGWIPNSFANNLMFNSVLTWGSLHLNRGGAFIM